MKYYVLGAAAAIIGIYLFFGESSRSGQKVTSEEYGEDWPFTVSEGIVHCYDGREYVFQTGGTKYSLNGWADTFADKKGYESNLHAIWRKDPKFPDLPDLNVYITIGNLTTLAEKLC